jgi:hypothetical protein
VEVGTAELDDASKDVVDVELRRQGPGVAAERLRSQGHVQWRLGFVHSTSSTPKIGPGVPPLEVGDAL